MSLESIGLARFVIIILVMLIIKENEVVNMLLRALVGYDSGPMRNGFHHLILMNI
jgi:hypothetical protein